MTEPAKDVILCLLITIVVVAFGACMRDYDVRTDADYQRDRAREHAVELACLRAHGLYHDGVCAGLRGAAMKLTLETIPTTTVEGTPEERCATLKILGLEPMIELPRRRGPTLLYRPGTEGDKIVEIE